MTPLHPDLRKKMVRAHLHLVDAKGTPLSSGITLAVETAFQWVIRDYPGFDQAQIADWAEEVGGSMHLRGSAIASPKRYAYVALGGKVRDWLRTATGKEELKGIGRDLERDGGISDSFAAQLDRKILFEQLETTLNERDRAILVLLLRDKSTTEIATYLATNYAAAAKAIQRVKDRMSAATNGKRHKGEPGHDAAHLCDTKG